MKPYDAPSGSRPSGAASAPLAPAVRMSDEQLLAALKTRGEEAEKATSWNALLVTGLLFVTLGGLSWGWRSVLFLAVAVAVHELGHVFAMRYFGYKNVRLLFLPLFGGLATGEPRELDATKNALVSLAGPAFGLASVLGAATAAMWLEDPAWLVEFAWVSLFLNAFNLLPLVPLDGGQFANDALFSRYPVLELIFRLLAVAGLAWITLAWEIWLLGVVALSMLLAMQLAYRRARLLRDARRDPRWRTRELDLEAVGELRTITDEIFENLPAAKYQPKLAEHVHGVWLEVRKRFPGPGKTAALLGGYVFLCAVLIPGLMWILVRYFPRPAF
jgi:Zn-dependent proteases